MPRDVPITLPDLSDELLMRLDSGDMTYGELANTFPDPKEAYICSPVKISLRRLIRVYEDLVDEDELEDFERDIRRRCSQERWVEQRAMFQSKRVSGRRDALIEAESQFWAMMALDFHATRVRSLWQRWEDLDAHVQERLEQIAMGQRPFTSDIRDACKELREVESQIESILPQLSIPEGAQRVWTGRKGTREAMLGRIGERLKSVAGADHAGEVFQLLEGGRPG